MRSSSQATSTMPVFIFGFSMPSGRLLTFPLTAMTYSLLREWAFSWASLFTSGAKTT